MEIFSDLGDIIEHAKLISQVSEIKNRKDINYWNYYFDGLKIQNELYSFEFEVRSMDDGQNQYRVQRLQKKQYDRCGDANKSTLPPVSQIALKK